MTDQDVRDFLERMATEEPVPFVDPPPLARRARRRAARTAVVGVIGVAAAVALVFAGASQLRVAPPNIPVTVPTAAPRPSPAPGFSTFSSPLHGITIDYPAGWTVRPATESGTHATVTFNASNVDVIFDPSLGDDVYLAQDTLGNATAELLELARVLEKLDDLEHFVLGFIDTGDISEQHFLTLFRQQTSAALSE